MNVYDFDKTIYKGDSTVRFYKFCVAKNIFLLRYLFVQVFAFCMYILGIYNKTKYKQAFFSFVKGIKNIDLRLEQFWNKQIKNIKKFYLDQQQEDDIIISASPEFLLMPICQKLKIKYLIASEVDKHTGKFLSENCKGEQKVKRLMEKFPEVEINKFYSDSLSDTPLAKLAHESYLVKGDKIKKWTFSNK